MLWRAKEFGIDHFKITESRDIDNFFSFCFGFDGITIPDDVELSGGFAAGYIFHFEGKFPVVADGPCHAAFLPVLRGFEYPVHIVHQSHVGGQNPAAVLDPR